ncbi:hypothetical protein [Endozoicomonas numazuensis]|nr:hypothetical protein [Endozoicomonas numazuensis]
MIPSNDAGNKPLECFQGALADDKQKSANKKKSKKGKKTYTAPKGASVACPSGASKSIPQKPTSPEMMPHQTSIEKKMLDRDTQLEQGKLESKLSLDEKRFRVPKDSGSEQRRVISRGNPSEKAHMVDKAMKSVVMTLQLDDLVDRGRALDQQMKQCKAIGEKLPLHKKPELRDQALQLIKDYEQYLSENPHEAQSLAVLKREAIQFHTGKHQIIRLSICHLKSQMLPRAEALVEDIRANVQSIDVPSITPYIKKYLNPYVVLMIELEQLRKLVTIYGIEKETFLEPCLDHMQRVSHSLNLFAKLFADLIHFCPSETSKTLLQEMCRRSISVVDDCLPVAWGGVDSELAREFWLDRLHYVALVDRGYDFPAALEGVDVCFVHYNTETCLKLLERVVAMAAKFSSVLDEGQGSYFELKVASDGLNAIQTSLENGFLKNVMDGKLPENIDSDEIADSRCSLKKAMSVLQIYQDRAEKARLREKAELDAFLKQMKEEGVSKPSISSTTPHSQISGYQDDDSGDEKQSEPEVKRKTDSAIRSDTVESSIAEASRLLMGRDQNPSRALFLLREVLKQPQLSADQKQSVKLGICEACLADGNERLGKVIEHRKHVQTYARCLESGQVISSPNDKAFVAAIQVLPQLQQALFGILERATAIIDSFSLPDSEGDLRTSSEMVLMRMTSFLATCQALVNSQVDLEELFRMRGSYIKSHLSNTKARPGLPLLTVNDVKYVCEVDRDFDNALENLEKAVEQLQGAFQRTLNFDEHFPPLTPYGDKG